MNALQTLYPYVAKADAEFVRLLSQHSFTKTLIQNCISKSITECLFLMFVVLFWYEVLYWSGIYIGLWEYHAKDIFKEVPVHCAHVYVRLNVVKKSDMEKVRVYYQLKRESPFNILNWKTLNEKGNEIFELNKFVKYHFEFSPEDFENNPDPELGSTIEHLREKVLDTFLRSSIHEKFYLERKDVNPNDVLVFNNKTQEVEPDSNRAYLSKVHIETGNIIDSIILI
ncbi:hypothetical protein METBIDRAFT_47095 [Metschnikowia bicuspidata var. bicuspidata NRRL YB-4993]|uniref:Uncharacterized protein n=1 Tax=Metschnikowia bicuspidata var. bicuspidata NRRL YB-4993 TaxID=869754 RepID=A0A1A0H5P3_9ASCO|nr:hypothetical protein METBIDRAFT_47095 [Metschnikowia bicuspidata var. bicuspidata NRRL YB-4993]OBA19275.1 hypothetical protein METBIDRAFT_47095 [Metschnikowia bicuspidata var. bicuspidata NRRL YB-4993]